MLRFEEAFDAWTESRLTQEEAARLLGVCSRTFRRYVDRFEESGIDGLVDKRLSEVSSRRAPVDEVVRLEALYRESYKGWSVAHFHERYRERHAGERSYTWVKNRLQESGLVAKGKRRGTPRRRRERSAIPGLLVHQHVASPQQRPRRGLSPRDCTQTRASRRCIHGDHSRRYCNRRVSHSSEQAKVSSLLVESAGHLKAESDEPGVDLPEGVLLPLVGGTQPEQG
ncbi:MAG: helix-turn-helix domain-containing protein [Gammaproteobacteria bacterium]|nr:helix-turn-helix domain-containing protein [Gammaproteobacteria bacterium]